MNSAAVVLHGNVMRAVLHAFADPGIAHSDWKIPNGGFYNIDVDSAEICMSHHGGNYPKTFSNNCSLLTA